MRRRRLRPFRLGLWLGAVAGAAWFVQRYQRSRQELDAVEAGGWSVVDATSEPVAPATAAVPADPIPEVPVVPVVEAEVREVGDVETLPGEPQVEPAVGDEPAPEPALATEEPTPAPPQPTAAADAEPELAVPPVKKAAAKRTAAKKAPARASKKAAPAPIPAAWVAPEPGGICPTTHPVKAKLTSKLFHLPGMFAYARTNPDRCYRDEAAAEADGLHRAKR